MNRTTIARLFGLVCTCVLAWDVSAGRALAHRAHALGGSVYIGSDASDFSFTTPLGGTAVTSTKSSGHASWGVPLNFDTTGAKTILVRGKVSGSGTLQCQAAALDSVGNVASLSSVGSFTPTASFTSISLSLSSVPAGSVGLVVCTFGGGSTVSFLLGVDYTP